MTTRDVAHMRSTAIGRIQVATEVRRVADEQLTSAMRCAHATGTSVLELKIETGLTEREIRRRLKGAA